jgi:hypothetical protein
LSWDREEANALVDGEDHSTEAREPTPPPQDGARAERMLEEATLVGGMYFADINTCRVE